jgi:hypothetical protein
MFGKWRQAVRLKKVESKKYSDFLKQSFTKPEIKHIKRKNAFIGMSEKAVYQSLGNPIETYVTLLMVPLKSSAFFETA